MTTKKTARIVYIVQERYDDEYDDMWTTLFVTDKREVAKDFVKEHSRAYYNWHNELFVTHRYIAFKLTDQYKGPIHYVCGANYFPKWSEE